MVMDICGEIDPQLALHMESCPASKPRLAMRALTEDAYSLSGDAQANVVEVVAEDDLGSAVLSSINKLAVRQLSTYLR
jgi:hypothetical protein